MTKPAIDRDAPRPRGTRCGDTCRRPTGGSQAHCSVCHRTFGGVSQFDRHRRDGWCLDPTTLGFVDHGGLWTTPEGHAKRAQLTEDRRAARARKTTTPEEQP